MVGVIERITNNLSEELDGKAIVLATGGDAELLANDIQVVNEIVPHLTLEGVFAAYVERAGGGVV
jgi:type III pantothenate kinase